MKPLLAAALIACAAPTGAEEVIFKCLFDWECDPNRKCGDVADDIRFKIDLDQSSVQRLGGNPLAEYELMLGDRAFTVLERPISGGSVTTTIMIGSGLAVHSENVIDGTTLEPRQSIGSCITVF